MGNAYTTIAADAIARFQVYGGNQGWCFIEEAYYKLLMEALLSKQQGSAEYKKIPLKMCPRRPGDATAVYASTDKAEKELGWNNVAAEVPNAVLNDHQLKYETFSTFSLGLKSSNWSAPKVDMLGFSTPLPMSMVYIDK
ncbi:UDP-glucose 4-epimerase GEPI42 [Glycine soja]|nr:hypothetical protein JHK86_051049 [Glycine max]KHN40650.1 UDP-glucose 4-epimerase GEPI42 [Glycine soja]